MKILFYNWVQFDDRYKRGGGVTVYLANLINQIVQTTNWGCTFLSSGLEYTFDGKLRIEETKNQLDKRVRTFQIVNSPVHAPACIQFSRLSAYLTDDSLYSLLDSFFKEHGTFDVIHFHNLEGLSLSTLRLKEKYPTTQFIYSIHNYYVFCPQVNLWSPSGNCYTNPVFPNCSYCIEHYDSRAETIIGSVKSCLGLSSDSKDSVFYNWLKTAAGICRHCLARNNRQINAADNSQIYQEYRNANVNAINRYMDAILAVSNRVYEIALAYGINPSKLQVNYIGTVAATVREPPRIKRAGNLRVGYLGYARIDKGFPFLLNVLKEIPKKISSKIEILIAAKCDTEIDFDYYSSEAKALVHSFAKVSFYNGFSKENQRELLSQIDLGIVPSLWEDNLPQIAIEYVAAGIPILSSDAGGASELCHDKRFVFAASDENDLKNKIIQFAEAPERVNQFWSSEVILTTMESHLEELSKIYQRK